MWWKLMEPARPQHGPIPNCFEPPPTCTTHARHLPENAYPNLKQNVNMIVRMVLFRRPSILISMFELWSVFPKYNLKEGFRFSCNKAVNKFSLSFRLQASRCLWLLLFGKSATGAPVGGASQLTQTWFHFNFAGDVDALIFLGWRVTCTCWRNMYSTNGELANLRISQNTSLES